MAKQIAEYHKKKRIQDNNTSLFYLSFTVLGGMGKAVRRTQFFLPGLRANKVITKTFFVSETVAGGSVSPRRKKFMGEKFHAPWRPLVSILVEVFLKKLSCQTRHEREKFPPPPLLIPFYRKRQDVFSISSVQYRY